VKQAEAWRKKAENRRAQIKAEYQTLANRIQSTTLTFTAKAGENGKLYGSVTLAQVAEKLNEKLGTEIDRRKIESEPLRQLGDHKVTVHLSGDFQPQFTVVINAEEEEAVAEPA
jgi:large subunit ribosomal protein L9